MRLLNPFCLRLWQKLNGNRDGVMSEILMKGDRRKSGEGEVAMNLRAHKIQMLIAVYECLAIAQQVVA